MESKKEIWHNNLAIDAYLGERRLKQHEEEMLGFLRRDYAKFAGTVLDIGCANGIFLEHLVKALPDAKFTAIELSPKLVEMAQKAVPQARILVQDMTKYDPEAPFDIVIASGVLSIFEDFEPLLEQWLSWLKPGGRLYIFGRFNTKPIDTIIRFRNHKTGGGWQSGLTTYSIHAVSEYLQKKGVRFEFKRFRLEIDLNPSEDPIRTFTLKTTDGQKLVINGANIVSEQYFLLIQK